MTNRSKSSEHLGIAVLLGGESDERDISLASGAAVSDALKSRGHWVTPLDPAEIDLRSVQWDDFDAAFIALHGRFGEDGQVQSLLDDLDVPYTGSGPTASRLAFSKSAAKERFLQAGVPTLPYVLIHRSDDSLRLLPRAEALGFPLVVKPDGQGSSLGVSIVEHPEALPAALQRCFEYDAFGLLEPAVLGTEWTVSLLGDEVLPPIQIVTGHRFFDFDAKYLDDETQHRFEFDLPAAVITSIKSAGRRASLAVGTRGLARVDLMLDGSQRPWVLEVNTVPGLTDHSLAPKAAAHAGIGFGELCERIIRQALATAPKRQALR